MRADSGSGDVRMILENKEAHIPNAPDYAKYSFAMNSVEPASISAPPLASPHSHQTELDCNMSQEIPGKDGERIRRHNGSHKEESDAGVFEEGDGDLGFATRSIEVSDCDDRVDVEDGDSEEAQTNNEENIIASTEETNQENMLLGIEEERLMARIEDSINYMRSLSHSETPLVRTCVTLKSYPKSPALTLLRRARKDGFVHRVYKTRGPGAECYSLAIPPAVTAKPFPGINPQWWANLSPAAIKAGPFAEKVHIKNAARILRAREKRRNKSRRWKAEEDNLEEGLRRQEARERMHGPGGVKLDPLELSPSYSEMWSDNDVDKYANGDEVSTLVTGPLPGAVPAR